MVSEIHPPAPGHSVTKQPPLRRTAGKAERTDLGDGWSIFTADPFDPPAPADLPIALSQAFARWLRLSPAIRVRATLPIVEQGNTTAIHVWWEVPG
jgi:hypothetical protein